MPVCRRVSLYHFPCFQYLIEFDNCCRTRLGDSGSTSLHTWETSKKDKNDCHDEQRCLVICIHSKRTLISCSPPRKEPATTSTSHPLHTASHILFPTAVPVALAPLSTNVMEIRKRITPPHTHTRPSRALPPFSPRKNKRTAKCVFPFNPPFCTSYHLIEEITMSVLDSSVLVWDVM